MDFGRWAIGCFGIQPSEFWRMTPQDFWLAHDGRVRQHAAANSAKRMTRDDYEDLRDDVERIIQEKGLE